MKQPTSFINSSAGRAYLLERMQIFIEIFRRIERKREEINKKENKLNQFN